MSTADRMKRVFGPGLVSLGRGRRGIVFGLCWTLSFAACTSYRPLPLDEPFSESVLAPPPLEEIAVAASEIQHPILEPLPIDLSDGVSPDEAALLAVAGNPELRAARAERGLSEAAVLRAGLLPDPVLDGSVDRPQNPGPDVSTGHGLGVAWDLEPLFARRPERRAAVLDQRRLDLDLASQEWSMAQRARAKVLAVLFLERRAAIAGAEEEALSEILGRLDEAAEKHLVSVVERLAAADALHSARTARLDLERETAATRLEVAQLLGVPPHLPLVLDGDIETAAASVARLADGSEAEPAADSGSVWIDGIERRRLDLLALQAGYASQEETVRAAVLRQFPRINLGVNRARDTGAVVTLGTVLSISLPVLDRNRGEIATERATREQLRQEYGARLFAARAEIAALLEDLRRVAASLENARQARREAQRLVTAYGEALRRRSADAVTFFGARVDLLAKETAIVMLQQEQVQLGLELQVASGLYRTFAADSGGSR